MDTEQANEIIKVLEVINNTLKENNKQELIFSKDLNENNEYNYKRRLEIIKARLKKYIKLTKNTNEKELKHLTSILNEDFIINSMGVF
jgi:hypothetical protein